MTPPDRALRRPLWHWLLLAAVAVIYESLFVQHGVNKLDEGWPLYAASALSAGRTLYTDVFFVFPPGHLLCAWIAHTLAPPGLILARVLYAAFDVALVLALYALGRRLMPAGFALLGAGLLAVSAPQSHLIHLLFGYRYLVLAVAALLCFERRVSAGSLGWMAAAGAFTGLALCFRLTPAFAVALAIGVGILVAGHDWRARLRDAGVFAMGLAAVALPVLLAFGLPVGLETLWQEVVVRPVAMTRLQALPITPLSLPRGTGREAIRLAFIAVQFRLLAALYLAYLAFLGWRLATDVRAGRRFDSVPLLTLVVFGAVYYFRSLGRADDAHLDSALPPALLLLAHALGLGATAARARSAGAGRAAVAASFAVAALWVYGSGTDRYLGLERRGTLPLHSAADRTETAWPLWSASIDRQVDVIRARTQPGDVVLDLSYSPLLHVLSGRLGPGGTDLVMPGSFLSPREERALIERLERHPPALVILTELHFDGTPARGLAQSAPRVLRWVKKRYALAERNLAFETWLPRAPGAAGEAG